MSDMPDEWPTKGLDAITDLSPTICMILHTTQQHLQLHFLLLLFVKPSIQIIIYITNTRQECL